MRPTPGETDVFIKFLGRKGSLTIGYGSLPGARSKRPMKAMLKF